MSGRAAIWRNRAFRRLMLVFVWLAIADHFVLPIVDSLERERYEHGRVFRFENSDLFGLGPLVEYLREYPKGERPRTLFFGNSVIWGYGLAPEAAVPAQLQLLQPNTKVFNIAINGFDSGSSYLIARAIIDSVDRLYVLRRGEAADPILPKLIEVSADDANAFTLPAPDRLEKALERSLRWWRLYHYSYRLQAALFGSSTRQYMYLHKGELVRAVIARLRAQQPPLPAGGAAISIARPVTPRPLSGSRIRALEGKHPSMWRFGALARDHRKRTTFLHIDGYSDRMTQLDIAAFNRLFAPFADIAIVRIPRALMYDGLHLTGEGSRALAEALAR